MIDRTEATERRLSRDEELELVRRAEAGDYEARNELMVTHLFVVNLNVRHFADRGLNQDDLYGEALLGLIDAAERFSSKGEARFRTFAAHRVRAALMRAVCNYGGTIRKRPDVKTLARKGHRVREQLAAELGRQPTLAEIVEGVKRLGGRDTRKADDLLAAMKEHHQIGKGDGPLAWLAVARPESKDEDQDDDQAMSRAEQVRRLEEAIRRMRKRLPHVAAYIRQHFATASMISIRGLAILLDRLDRDILKARRHDPRQMVMEAIEFLREEVKKIE